MKNICHWKILMMSKLTLLLNYKNLDKGKEQIEKEFF